MADTGGTPQLPGSNMPKLPGSGGGKNPLEKKELDVLDPEAKAKEKGKKGLGDVAKGIKKSIDNIKRIINFIKSLPPQVWLVIGIIILIIFLVGGLIGFILFIPGLTINALKQFAQGAIDTVQSWFTTDADAYINEQDVIDLANYLEEMEYNLVGYGFITPNSNYSEDLGFLTYTELMENGYIYFERRDGDENARYYNEAGEAYDGYYYNSLGILIDNSTGAMVTGEYTDQYGIQRSTEETSNSGAGKIVGFGEDFASLGITGSILDHLLDWTVDTKLLRTYLLSDYRIYSIRNNDQGLLANIFKGIKQTFGGYDSAWSKGLIKFYYSQNGIATSEWSSGLGHWIVYGDDISITRTSTGGKMSVKNGHFNNPTIFTIDGWSDRYGMSLEFLLSLHIATMQPDLVYAMLQNFDTEVQVYLEDSGESTVDAAYVDMLNENASVDNEDDRITINDVEETLSEGGFDIASWAVNDMAATEWVNGLAITKKNAYYLLRNLPLESPPNCTGQAQAYVIEESTYETESFLWIDTSTNALLTYGITQDVDSEPYDEMSDYTNYSFNDDDGNPLEFTAEHCTQEIGTENPDYENDTYSWLAGYAYDDYGFSEDIADVMEPQIDNLETEVTTISGITTDPSGMSGSQTLTYTDYSIKKVKQERNWDVEVTLEDGSTEFINYEWITYKYLIYKTKSYKQLQVYSSASNFAFEDSGEPYDVEEFDNEWVDTVMVEFIVREKNTDELIDANLAYRDEDGNIHYNDVADTRCSDNAETDKCCSNCKRYVKDVVQALGAISDQDYATYTPFIARVLGSWFRDTYFIIPEYADTAIQDYINEASRSQAELDTISNSYGENSTLVTVDEEYLAETEEYWTAYEMKTDSSGNPTEEYQLYYLYPNGITSDIKMEDFIADPYSALEGYKTGYAARYNIESGNTYTSQGQAEEAGHAFVKKAKTVSVTELSDSTLEDVLWSAYEFNSDGAATGWMRVEYEDDNDEVNDVYDTVGDEYPNPEGGFYYNITSTNEVTQIEDAQRSETNTTVKWLFKYRKYYTYDGTEETAMKIADDKSAVLTWAENYLKNTLNVSASSVAVKLGNYGRSALRQTYSNTTITFDWVDVAEQWLDWQLDMYYSGIITGPEGDFKLDDLAFIVTKDDDGNVTSIVETTDFNYEPQANEELRIGDPRNPDLIGTTNITKSSLEAFTILENTKTLAAEYAYRDFKELIVELNYFDKEDLSEAVEEVFTWVLPDMSPIGWPVRPWDKQNTDYGALIESKGTYNYLEETDYGLSDEDAEDSSGDSSSTDTDSDTDTEETVDVNRIQFVGDSWIDGLRTSGAADSTYFYGQTGKDARDPEMSIDNITVASDASAIVLYLGVNDTSSANEMNALIDALTQRYDIPLYVVKVTHVGTAYTTIDAATMNSNIDTYNSEVEAHCNSVGVTFIDTTTEIQDSDGYLKAEYTSDGLHLNSNNAYNIWYNSIIDGISGASNGTRAVSFDGFEGGEYVSSPVTGKIVEYGTHDRINVYTGESEEVGYIVIEAISSEIFTAENVANNSQDTDGISNEDAANGLNLFYEEYEETCAGYTITIDGFKVDLNTTDDEGNNGTYEQNEVMALYNSAEQERREENEQLKDDAPFFVNNGESADLGSLPDEFYCDLTNSSTGYYIKEGKYLGVTYTDSEAAALTITTDTPEDSGTDDSTDTTDEEEYTGPANYIRIMVKDREYSIIDNVEDYFDIPEPSEGTGGTGEYGDLEAITETSTDAEKVRAAMTYFISQGFTAEGAAGIMGNLIQESNLDPTIVSASGYHGLAQWNTSDAGGHWWDADDGIRAWIISQGYNETDYAGQIRAIYEANRRGQMTEALWAELKALTNIEQAAELFAVYYEGCIGGSDPTQWYNPGTNYQELDLRKRYAQNAYDIYMGDDSIGIKD